MTIDSKTEAIIHLYEDTIIAVSTPRGRGAIGVVRVSGRETRTLLQKVCRTVKGNHSVDFENLPRSAIYCTILDEAGDRLDDALVTYFPSPASFTGEDMAEFSLHGNPILLDRFVHAAIVAARIRPAEAGEFSRRAFHNGKLDLTQAEAVRRIIEARSEYEIAAGQKILSGELSRMVSRFRSSLISLSAETEAEVDFSDEDLTFESLERRRERVQSLIRELEEILERAKVSGRIAAGFQVAFAGIPNAGKSSLMNHILGWDRAIVSPTAGTTRDYLSEEIQIDGVPVRIVDTAGLRESSDEVEAEGIRRSRKEIDRSQLVLHVIDGSVPAYEFPPMHHHGSVIHVVNKSDVLHPDSWNGGTLPEGEEWVSVSCVEGSGLQDLREMVRKRLFREKDTVAPLLLEERHRYHFLKIRDSLLTIMDLWDQKAPDEIVASELNTAMEHAGEITGRISNEEVLGRIFSMFCIGK